MSTRTLKTSGYTKQESLDRIRLVLNEPTSQEMVETAPQPSFKEARPSLAREVAPIEERATEHPLPSPYEESLMRLPGEAHDPELIRAQAELILAQAQADALRAAEHRAQIEWEDSRADFEHASAMRRNLAAETRANFERAQRAASIQFQRDLNMCVVNAVPPAQYPRWADYDQSQHAQLGRGGMDAAAMVREQAQRIRDAETNLLSIKACALLAHNNKDADARTEKERAEARKELAAACEAGRKANTRNLMLMRGPVK
jgi:hypothetical protein